MQETEAARAGSLLQCPLGPVIHKIRLDLEPNREGNNQYAEAVASGQLAQSSQLFVHRGPGLGLPGGTPIVSCQPGQLLQSRRILLPRDAVSRVNPTPPGFSLLFDPALEPARPIELGGQGAMPPEPPGPAQLARESPGWAAVIQIERDHHKIRLRRQA